MFTQFISSMLLKSHIIPESPEICFFLLYALVPYVLTLFCASPHLHIHLFTYYQKFFDFLCYIFIEYFGDVWYNTNCHGSGRLLVELRTKNPAGHVVSHTVARSWGKLPKSILIIRKGVLYMFCPLYTIRCTLSEMLSATHYTLSERRAACDEFSSTTVECTLQIHPFLKNKANFQKSQINVSDLIIREYE